ncbi:MAG: outer membrane PBP1 activator LpoA protein [Oceanospirillaceae bacterium]|jgi:outer membrane PBP1 activator LpoA protein
MTTFQRLAMITLFAILATACSTPTTLTPGASSTIPNKNVNQQINALLVLSQTAEPLKAAQLKLQVAKLMLTQNRFQEASNLLDQIAMPALPDTLKFKLIIAKAKTALGLNNGVLATQHLLGLPDNIDVSKAQLNEKHLLLAKAYGLTNRLGKEAEALINASDYVIDNEARFTLNERIWSVLKTLDTQQLNTLNSQTDNSYTLRGWLALMLLFQETPNSEKVVANNWFKRWVIHSAARFQPQELAAFLQKEPINNSSYQSSHVVVALPSSGKYAKGAKAILQGIKLAAVNNPNSLKISYIDTAVYNSATDIIAQAQALQADNIIGPIQRDLVSQFAIFNTLPIPVLALNNSAVSNSNLYQYSLGNDDEVRDAAQRAFDDGRRNMLLLVPATEQGSLASNTFINHFNSLGGQVLSTTDYDTSNGTVTQSIAEMLKLNQGAIRGLQKRLKTAHLRSAIRRMTRKDADGIFLLASPADAYQIGPSISYFYADNIPLYATSRIYRGKNNAVKDIDLNGMMFGDLPWVLSGSTNKQQLASTVGKTETRFGRLYAFGIDALNLSPKLYELSINPESSYLGETGRLSISSDNIVQKTLTWAKFQDGIPNLLDQQ